MPDNSKRIPWEEINVPETLEEFRARNRMIRDDWERGVRDGFASGIRGLCPDTADPYSYWSGWSEGDVARHGEEVTVEVAKICGLLINN